MACNLIVENLDMERLCERCVYFKLLLIKEQVLEFDLPAFLKAEDYILLFKILSSSQSDLMVCEFLWDYIYSHKESRLDFCQFLFYFIDEKFLDLFLFDFLVRKKNTHNFITYIFNFLTVKHSISQKFLFFYKEKSLLETGEILLKISCKNGLISSHKLKCFISYIPYFRDYISRVHSTVCILCEEKVKYLKIKDWHIEKACRLTCCGNIVHKKCFIQIIKLKRYCESCGACFDDKGFPDIDNGLSVKFNIFHIRDEMKIPRFSEILPPSF